MCVAQQWEVLGFITQHCKQQQYQKYFMHGFLKHMFNITELLFISVVCCNI